MSGAAVQATGTGGNDVLHCIGWRGCEREGTGPTEFPPTPDHRANFERRGTHSSGDYSREGWHARPYDRARDEDDGVSHVGKGPRGYRRSDERIHEEICETLAHLEHLALEDRAERTEDGTVVYRATCRPSR